MMNAVLVAGLALPWAQNGDGWRPAFWDADRRMPAVFRDASADLLEPLQDQEDEPEKSRGGGFSIGPVGGFLKARDADEGTWFAGAQARLRFLRILAAEAAITFHQNEYNDGDTRVTQYPVQLSLMLFPLPNFPVSPYVVGGVGWYYTRIDYSGALSAIDNETDHWFGGHVGGGAELLPSRSISLFADFRYIFIDPKTDIQNVSGNADYWQVLFGLGFGF